jgi:hypothetical protein
MKKLTENQFYGIMIGIGIFLTIAGFSYVCKSILWGIGLFILSQIFMIGCNFLFDFIKSKIVEK